MIQGKSRATIDKERCISSALAVNLQIVNASAKRKNWQRYTYWHFDANSGTGWNRTIDDKTGQIVIDVPGSPLVFHAVADRHLTYMRRQAWFCDINVNAIKELQYRLAKNQSHYETSVLLPGDNEEALGMFGARISELEKIEHAVGSLIIDPNGYWYRGNDNLGPPTAMIRDFCEDFPKIDIILNLNIRLFHCMRSHPWGRDVPTPRDVLGMLNKKHWLIRMTKVGQTRFLLAVGRNTPTRNHGALGMYDLNSEEGRYIIDRAERKKHGKLFEASLFDIS